MGFGPRFEIPHTVDGKPCTIVMRGQQPGDAEALADMMDDYTVQRFMLIRASFGLKDEEEWLESTRTNRAVTSWLISVIQDDKEVLIGNTALRQLDCNRLASGILLAKPEYWGKGIASLTHRLRTWYAFAELGAYAIESDYIADNVASG